MYKIFLAILLSTPGVCIADESKLLPVPSTYANYKAFYQALLQEDPFFMLNGNEETLLKLATDSMTDIVALGNAPHEIAYIIEVNYFDGGNAVRGASGNGSFYIIRPTTVGLKLIGRFWGNGYKINIIDGIPNIGVSARGADKNPYAWYVWNSNTFEKRE